MADQIATQPVSKAQSFIQWAGVMIILVTSLLRFESRMTTVEVNSKITQEAQTVNKQAIDRLTVQVEELTHEIQATQPRRK